MSSIYHGAYPRDLCWVLSSSQYTLRLWLTSFANMVLNSIYTLMTPNSIQHSNHHALALKSDSIKKLEACIEDIRKWMSYNMLKLNEDKTEFLIISSRDQINDISINVGGCDVRPSNDPPRNLGVLFDSTCSLSDHVNKLCKSLNYNIFSIGKIRKYLDKSTAEILVNSLVTSKMDYCNSLLYGINDCQIEQNHDTNYITLKQHTNNIHNTNIYTQNYTHEYWMVNTNNIR